MPIEVASSFKDRSAFSRSARNHDPNDMTNTPSTGVPGAAGTKQIVPVEPDTHETFRDPVAFGEREDDLLDGIAIEMSAFIGRRAGGPRRCPGRRRKPLALGAPLQVDPQQ